MLFLLSLRQRLTAGNLHDCFDTGFDAAGKIATPKPRHDDFLDDSVCDRVGKYAFEAVADFDTQLAIVLRDHEDSSVIETFPADLPVFRDPDTEALDVFALQAGNSKDSDLMAGVVFKLLQTLLQRLSASRRHEVGVIIDAPAKRRHVERDDDGRRCKECKENEAQEESSDHLKVHLQLRTLPEAVVPLFRPR